MNSARFALAIVAVILTWPPAEASAQETAPATRPADMPASVDLRPQFREYGLPPRPQGARGTCSVFTAVGAIEFAMARTLSSHGPLSVEFANWASNDVAGDRGDGSFFDDCLNGFRKHGICYEETMPYRAAFDAESRPSHDAIQEAKAFKAMFRVRSGEIHWILPPRNDDPGLTPRQFTEIKQTLAHGNPVAFGSGHSVLLVGYQDDPKKPGGGEFRIKDSAANAFRTYTYEFVRTKPYDVFWVECFRERQPRLRRTVWEYAGGTFHEMEAPTWNERGNNGNFFSFRETARNDDWVELRDDSRELTVRITGHTKSQLFYRTPKMRRWELMYDGRWEE